MDDRNLYGKAYGLDQRGRHMTFGKALDAALKGILRERGDFYTSLCDNWARLFPTLPAQPGRYADGTIFVYVRSSPLMYVMRPKLRAIKEKLAQLPNAPKKLTLKLEIHAT